jgi:hypothetical protein
VIYAHKKQFKKHNLSYFRDFFFQFAVQARYPDRVNILRGNHETRMTSQVYGFYDEVMVKYGSGSKLWNLFMDVCDYLPVTALVGGKVSSH